MDQELFDIPIEEYEVDLNTHSGKEKKKEILDLLTKSNHLHSVEEFEEIKQGMHQACKRGDIELIKIYLCETIEIESLKIFYKIDKTNQTASLFKINNYDIEELIIPRTIHHDSTDYLITSIISTYANIKTIKFSEDSAVETIYKITSSCIYFPASLKELKEDWCFRTEKLNKIVIPPSNGQFIFKNDQYLLGKSDPNKNEFDVLLFAARNIKKISIPSNIKVISSYAFCDCKNLAKIEIPPNSNLQTIGDAAFSHSKIKEIYFPANLKELKQDWCSEIKELTKIVISPSNGQFIFKDDQYLLGKSDPNKKEFDVLLFARRDIKEFSIPSNIKVISSSAFCDCENLTKIEIPPNSNLQTIGDAAFYGLGINEIFIPSTVTKIGDFAFSNCSKVTKINFEPNSSLKETGESAFSFLDINEFCMPTSITKICNNAFFHCKNLEKFEIPPNSNLRTIESAPFFATKIKEIYLPASLKELKEGWCRETSFLKKIIISPSNGQFMFKENKYLIGKSDPNNDDFDVLHFARRDIKEISIPSNIKIISSYAFQFCQQLMKAEIPPDSNLQIIQSNAFVASRIEKIFIPSKVFIICNDAFYDCPNLKKVCIPSNSNLRIIKQYAFSDTNIKSFFIPSKISKIDKYSFRFCTNIQIIEISEELKIESFLALSFCSIFINSPKVIIMIPLSLGKLINKNKLI